MAIMLEAISSAPVLPVPRMAYCASLHMLMVYILGQVAERTYVEEDTGK
jgi:hypothetical protein